MTVASLGRRLFRFSLAGLLFITLCLCVYLRSHRIGEQAGAQQQYDESFFVKTYNIEDLLIETETSAQRDKIYAETAARIRTTVSPQSWTELGDQRCEIVELRSNGSLVVSQYGKVHDQIPLALREIRRRRLESSTRRALDEIDALSQQTASSPAVLLSYPQSNFAQADRAISNRFAELTEELTQRWGAPAFAGECTNKGFPAWSAAESLATWPQGDGEIYLAIQFCPDIGEALVAGWHPVD